MSKSSQRGDIDYIKSLAEAGRDAPILGGRIGLMWSVLACITLFIHYLALTGTGPVPINRIGLVWMTFGIVGTIASVILSRSLYEKPGLSSIKNRLAQALWTGNNILIFVYALAAGVSASLGRVSFAIMDTILPLAFGLYALTAYVLYKVGGEKSGRLQGMISILLVPVSLYFQGDPVLYLIAIAGILLTQIIPNILYMTREPGALSES